MPRSPLKRRARLRAGQRAVSPKPAERPKFGSAQYRALYGRKPGVPLGRQKRLPGCGTRSLIWRLKPLDRGKYMAFASEPGATLAGCQKWLANRGYVVGLRAIRTLRKQQRGLQESQLEHIHRVMALNRVRQFLGPTEAVDAATNYVEEQMLMEMAKLLKAKSQGEFDAPGWKIVAEVVEKLAKTRQAINRGRAAKADSPQAKRVDELCEAVVGKRALDQ